MNIYSNLDNLLDMYTKKIYQFCFLMAIEPTSARKNAFQSFLYVATTKKEMIEETDEKEEIFRSAIRTSEDYYLAKMHRKPKRENLQKNVRFFIDDLLWQILCMPFKEKAVLYLSFVEDYTKEQIANLLKMRTSHVEHLLSRSSINKETFLGAIHSIPFSEDDILLFKDDIYYRFEKRSVGFENKLLNIRSFMDRAIIWIALAIIILCVAAVWYTA